MSKSSKYNSLLQGAVAVACTALLACTAQATPMGFSESFDGTVLDPAWTASSYTAGQTLSGAGEYLMTAIRPPGNPKLQNFNTGDANPLDPYVNEISIRFDTFLLTGSGGTQSDFKWKSFGANGFMEVVLNSFGDMRAFHNDGAGTGGNIQPNINIGIADGDVLGLKTAYTPGAGTVDITYSLNGGVDNPFYSGVGITGPVGDIISNFVEVEVFKWGDAEPTQPFLALDQWDLTVIPEPGVVTLLALGGGMLLIFRRRP